VIAPIVDAQDEPNTDAEGTHEADEITEPGAAAAGMCACRTGEIDDTVVTAPHGVEVCDERTELYGPRERALAAAEKLTRPRRSSNVEPPRLLHTAERLRPIAARDPERRPGLAFAIGLAAVLVAITLTLVLSNL
jgi:hypothetical protein